MLEPTANETAAAPATVQFNLAKAFDVLVESLADRECVVGQLAKALRDAPAVEGAEDQRLEYEEVQGPL